MNKLNLVLSIAAISTGLGLTGALVAHRAVAIKEIQPSAATSISLTKNQDWQPLAELVSDTMLTEIVEENTAPSADRAAIAASAIGVEKNDLLVIDFQSSSLCGVGGCAVAAYRISTGDRILSTYANRASPTGPLVEIVEKGDESLPCISVLGREGDNQETFCYRGTEWITDITS